MELEYKWKLSDLSLPRILAQLEALHGEVTASDKLEMRAVYYDTPDQLFKQKKGALRIREENGQRICCMKIAQTASGACTSRQEYEVPADTLAEGLEKLPEQGASREFCRELLRREIVQLCRIEFTRMAYQVKYAADGEVCTGELAVDGGTASREGISAPISELEFEYKSGSEALFHRFAAQLRDALSLEPQTASKLAQIMQAK